MKTLSIVFSSSLILVVVILLFIAVSSPVISPTTSTDQSTVTINQTVFRVDIVDKIQEQRIGLSGRDNLAQDQGMLFLFPDKHIRNFWMPNMNFAIDLLWIDDNTIIGYEQNMLPATPDSIITYKSPQPVDKVLEIPTGSINKFDFNIGDKVNINL
jgi:uncharacterized protein